MNNTNRKIRSVYPAPNTVILSHAVKLTAWELKVHKVSVEQIEVQDDCTVLVDFLIDVNAGLACSAKASGKAAVAIAQSRLERFGIPLTAQRILQTQVANSEAGQGTIRIQCRFFVEPQESWGLIGDFLCDVRVHKSGLCVDVETKLLISTQN